MTCFGEVDSPCKKDSSFSTKLDDAAKRYVGPPSVEINIFPMAEKTKSSKNLNDSWCLVLLLISRNPAPVDRYFTPIIYKV